MEHRILIKLQFSVTFPSSLRFVERFAKLAQLPDNDKQILLARYFTDTALLDCSLVSDAPSHIAAVSLYAAFLVCRGSSSTGQLWN